MTVAPNGTPLHPAATLASYMNVDYPTMLLVLRFDAEAVKTETVESLDVLSTPMRVNPSWRRSRTTSEVAAAIRAASTRQVPPQR